MATAVSTSTPTQVNASPAPSAPAKAKAKVNRDTKNLRPYIRRVLGSGQDKMKLSKQALDALNEIAQGKIRQITKGAIEVADSYKVMTISGREVKTAAASALSGDVGQQAVARGLAALDAYGKTLPAKEPKVAKADAKKKAQSPKKKPAAKPAAAAPPAGPKKGRKAQSRNSRAGLKISISRVENNMRPLTSAAHKKLGRSGAIVMAGIIEQLLTAIFEAAAKVTRDAGRVKIMQKALPKALKSNVNLFTMLADVYHASFPSGDASEVAGESKPAKKAKKAAKPKAKAGKKKAGKAKKAAKKD